MTKAQKEDNELALIKSVLTRFPIGASLEEIKSSSGIDWQERTLQRRLAKLEKEFKEINVSGATRTTRYHLIGQVLAESLSVEHDLIPLSKDGQSILKQVSKPIQQRKPVSYERTFLDAYEPNKTSYLTDNEIGRLSKIGNTALPDEPAGTYAREILSRLLIDLSWNSSRLEGNTYSLIDTQRLIAFGKSALGKSATDTQMILNHKEAIEFLVQSVEETGFNRYTVLNLHGLLSNNLLADPSASGRLRSIEVGISHSVYLPIAIPQLISELFNVVLAKARAIENPFEQAFFIIVHLPYLQPFDDVNKRVSRLAANIPFLRHNLSPLSFIDVPSKLYLNGLIGVYELNRVELLKDIFLWAYERSALKYTAIQQSLGEPDPFRLKYRLEMRSLISGIVTNGLNVGLASNRIEERARELPPEDQNKFIEAVETEVLSLHEGNIARYQIRLSDFEKWQISWQTIT